MSSRHPTYRFYFLLKQLPPHGRRKKSESENLPFKINTQLFGFRLSLTLVSMEALTATYEWKSPTTGASTSDAASSSLPSPPPCRSVESMSPAELEVQQLKAKAELTLLRDRVRKVCVGWLGEPQSRKPTAAPIRFEWKVEPSELVRHLGYWQRTSALTRIGMTPCLVELTRQHRKLEGTSSTPPPSKNKLTLVVWNLAATVQTKLREWQACVAADAEEAFVASIVVRVSDLVPLWTWEADLLRHRPALANVCDRMLSMELWQYRQRCNQLTKREKKLARGGQVAPYLTPFGLCWPPVDVPAAPNSAKATRASLEPASSSTAAPATTTIKSRLKLSQLAELSIDPKSQSSSKQPKTSKLSKLAEPSKPSKVSESSRFEPPSRSKFLKSSNLFQPWKSAASVSGDAPSKVFAGETFCVSGPFTVDQQEMLALIRNHAGSTASTVSRTCTYLVADQLGSAKTKKAQANGVPIVSEDWIRASIAEGKKSTDASLFVDDSTSSSNRHSAFSKLAQPTRTDDDDDDDDDEDENDLDCESESEHQELETWTMESEPDSADDLTGESDLDDAADDRYSGRQERRPLFKPTSTHAKLRLHRNSFK